MELTLRFFADFREVVGEKTIVREYDDVSTVGDALAAISEEYPEMELYEADGSVREFITIMRDGRDVVHVDGMATELEGGETLSVFSPVAGG
jgi:molybdopterin synthase sulfur carrier subunit